MLASDRVCTKLCGFAYESEVIAPSLLNQGLVPLLSLCLVAVVPSGVCLVALVPSAPIACAQAGEGRPVVVTDAFRDWAAMRGWSLGFFRSACGDVPVTINDRQAQAARVLGCVHMCAWLM